MQRGPKQQKSILCCRQCLIANIFLLHYSCAKVTPCVAFKKLHQEKGVIDDADQLDFLC